MRSFSIAALAVFVLAPGLAGAVPADTAVLQAMDKITARVSRLEVAVGTTIEFGALSIAVRACDKAPPEETPEASAFLEISEKRQGEAEALRFQGWMFASSPALSAMEHPVYDIWVVDCVNKSSSAPGGNSP